MEQFIIAYVVVTLVALALAYVLIRFGVQHGTRAALREHEMWMRDGSLEKAMDAHAAKILERAEEERYAQRVRDRERG